MRQDDVAGKILIELLDQNIIEETDEFTVYTYLTQAYAAGMDFGRSQIKKRKPVAQYDLRGNLLYVWDSISEAGKSLRIPPGSISDVVSGRIRKGRTQPKQTAGGFVWKKVNEKSSTSSAQTIGSIQAQSTRPK